MHTAAWMHAYSLTQSLTHLCELWAVLPPLSFNVGWQHSLIQRVSKVLSFVNTKHTGFWTFDHGWRERVREGKIEAPLDVVFTGFGFKYSSCQAFSVSQTLWQIIPWVLQKKLRAELQIPAVQDWTDGTSKLYNTHLHISWRPTGTLHPTLTFFCKYKIFGYLEKIVS